MDVTNGFVLQFARSHGGRVLDYGCGRGEVVLAGRETGLEIYGTDVFYGGAETRPPAVDFIREMRGGVIPYPDRFFDLVTNNQVMEHVEDLDTVLAEIHRVLKPGGQVLSLFPAADVWREGHIGIPFAHWFRPGSRLRFYYTWALRALGAGTWKDQAPTARQWAIDKLEWIDRWTRYRSRKEIFAIYGQYFSSELRESDYIRYRLLARRSAIRQWLAHTAEWPGVGALERAVFRKLAFLVILSTKTRT